MSKSSKNDPHGSGLLNVSRNPLADARPLRIALYAPAMVDSGISNGVVTYTGIMRDALRKLGHAVTIFSPSEMERADGEIRQLPRPTRISVMLERLKPSDGCHAWVRRQVLNAVKTVKNDGAEVLEMEESFGWAGRVDNTVPVVMRLHGPHCLVNEDAPDPRRVRAEMKAFSSVRAITAPTEALLQAMAARGVSAGISRVIPNPIPLPREQWEVGQANQNQILFVGRIDQVKGADIAVKAFARAVEKNPALKLLMVGPGVPIDAPHQVQFLGPLAAHEIMALRLSSGLQMSTSRFENFPYSIAEAMCLGMPVLTSGTLGGLALTERRKFGWAVDVGRIGATASAILRLTGNPHLLASIGAAARERCSTYLNPEKIASETVEVYRAAIAKA